MTLQWTIVATFLYMEVGCMAILLLPFISPTRWNKIFKSRFVMALTSYAKLYFNVILAVLVLLLLDAIREIMKFKTKLHSANDPEHGNLHYGPTMELVKEFRAQRNFYISGVALFLWFVMKRLIQLISNTARLIADNQAAKSQAESANRTATALMDSASKTAKSHDFDKLLNQKDEELQALSKQMNSAKSDMNTMKKQAEGITFEYDNLLKEHAKILAKLEKFEYEGSSGNQSKKGN